MSDSEVITILIYFHLRQFRNLKHFYVNYIQAHCQEYFPHTVSYNRFVELQQKAVLPMAVFLKMCCLGKCTGISFIDSTSIQACHTCTAYKVRGIKRERSHKTFKGLATKGAWLQTAYRHQRQGRNTCTTYEVRVLDFVISQANTDDRQPLKDTCTERSGVKGFIKEYLVNSLVILVLCTKYAVKATFPMTYSRNCLSMVSI